MSTMKNQLFLRLLFWALLLGICFVLGTKAQIEDEDLIVDAGVLGRVRGSPALSAADQGVRREYIQFRGIPYGTVPDRFLPSRLLEEPLTSNGDIFNATTTPLSCFQPLLPVFIMTEDCLTINIYTHKKDTGNDRELRPVIFFVHGGAFTVGSGASFSGLRILNRDVVYVSFNYRLGLNGFFSLQNENIPGNAGMYDVVNALKWTNKYIRHFGGDPTLLTLAGQSAGSVTVTQLMVSPLAQGLFHRAIAASGSALNAWGTSTNPIPDALTVAKLSGCYDDPTPPPNLDIIAFCMRQVDPMTLVNALYEFQVAERKEGRLGFGVVSPVVQDFPMTAYSKFLPEHPREVFSKGEEAQVPLMMGATKHDGSYVMGVFYNRYLVDNGLENNATFLENQLTHSILDSLGVLDISTAVHDALSLQYLEDSRHSGNFSEMFPGLVDIFSVFFFKGDAYHTALMHSRTAPTYWYSFDFRGHMTLWESLFPGEVVPFPGGVTHTDDLIYLYSLTFGDFTPEEANMSTTMLSYWANFAERGNPTPGNELKWPVLDEEERSYMEINEVSQPSTDYAAKWVGPGRELYN